MLFLGGKIVASFFIAYGDFKERKVMVLVLLLLFIVNLIDSFIKVETVELLKITVFNIVVVSCIFGLTYIYLRKVKKIENPAQSHLGIGDWLFFIALTPLFLPEVFIYVFLLMNIVSLLYGIVTQLVTKGKYEIPYAGISAVLFVFISITQYVFPLEILTLN